MHVTIRPILILLCALGTFLAHAAGEASGSYGNTSAYTGKSYTEPVNQLALINVAELPPEVLQTLQLIERGGPFPYDRDGIVFGNFERRLPKQPRGYYREYTVPTPGARNRGARRLIVGDQGAVYYYTGDHYQTFQRIIGHFPSASRQ